MWTLLYTAALAAPPDYTPVKTLHGCELARGPAEADGVSPMLAECHWPDVAPDDLVRLIRDYEGYDELIFAIERSEVWRVEEDSTLILQRQTARGIAPREVLIRMSTHVDGSTTRVAWTTGEDSSFIVSDDAVRSPRNEGSWTVTPHPAGGTRVEHRVAYDPGGMVPAWVVRWASVGGLLQVMGEVRASAANP